MAGLTKQHFEEIAKIISFYSRNCDYFKNDLVAKDIETQFKVFLNALADYFETQNPQFNRNRFIKACLE